MNQKRGHWYLLTGIVLGAIVGLVYAWVVQPVQYINTSPASLRIDYKDHYRALIAAAYNANHDLVRAIARLDLLKDEDIYRSLAEQAQRALAQGKSFEEARLLAMLAAAVQNPTAASVAYATNPAQTPAISATEALSSTIQQSSPYDETNPLPTGINITTPTSPSTDVPLPTRTPTATPGAPFVLANKNQSCDKSLGQGLIEVFTLDSTGQPVPGVEIVVTWQGGENHFFTGLKPNVGIGYADFTMSPGITYTLQLAQGGQPIPGLTINECENSESTTGERYWGNWVLEFVQP